MLLIDEVRRLRKIFPRIKDAKIMTPLLGGGIDDVYEFMGDMLLVREIWGRIIFSDPNASKFPKIKRTMEVEFIDRETREKKVQQKKVGFLLGMIIHCKYFVGGSSDNTLDVVNDRGERFIGSFEEFIAILESLLLNDDDVIFVMCGVIRRQMEELKKAHERLIEERKKIGGSVQEQERQVSDKDGSYYLAHKRYYDETDILWDMNVGANLDWLLDHYFGANGSARNDLKPFLPEDHQKERNFYRFYFTNRNITDARYIIKFGGAWGKGMNEKCWIGWMDVNILLSIIEKHMRLSR